MALKDNIPKQLRGPVGFGSLGVMVVGLVVGYVFVMAGVTLYFGSGKPAESLTGVESLTIAAVGFGLLVVGYLGWKGFNYFAY